MNRILFRKTVVHNGKRVRIIVRRVGEFPTVVCDGDYFLPSAWEGRRDIDGEVAIWEYPMGPVRKIETRVDAEGNHCTLIGWR
jgi:hypothetical protein